MRRGRFPVAVLVGILVTLSAVAGVTGGTTALAQEPPGPESTPSQLPAGEGRETPVVVVSIPYVHWEDLADHELPNIEALLGRAAVSSFAPRTARAATTLERAYATLGAGNRANAGPAGAAAFNRYEIVDDASARQTYTRRTGMDRDADVYHLGLAPVQRSNSADSFGAVVGALATALVDEGIATAVIGNADGPTLRSGETEASGDLLIDGGEEGAEDDLLEQVLPPTVSLGRSVALGAMTEEGIVPIGSVGTGLLEPDATKPFGAVLDLGEVARIFDESLGRGAGLILVEASDLVRAERETPLVTDDQGEVAWAEALQRTDELLGVLLDRLPSDQATYILVSPAPSRRDTAREQLTVFAMAGPDVERGLALSPSTRRAGVVTAPDVAPTILDLLGVERSDDMTGRAVTVEATDEPPEELVESFVLHNEQALSRDRMTPTIFVMLVLTHVLVYVAAAVYLWNRRSSWLFAFLAVWVMYLPISMFLLRLLPLHRFGPYAATAVIWAIALMLAAASWPLRRWWNLGPILAVSLVTLVVLGLDVAVGSPLELNSPLGYSTIVAARFVGFGNLGYALFYGAAIVVAWLVVNRYGRTRNVGVAIALLFAAVVAIDGAPSLGSDVGGILSGVPAFAITWFLLMGRRVRARTVVLAGVATLAVLAAFAVIDLLRPEEVRTHLGRTVETVFDGGSGAFGTILSRKIDANLRILRSSQFVILFPITVAFLIAMTFMNRGVRQVIEGFRALRGCLVGLLVTGILGMVVNDSGVAIPTMLLGIVVPMLLYLRSIEPSEAERPVPEMAETPSLQEARA